MELDRPDWVWGTQPEQPTPPQPPRRTHTRIILAALVAVAVAAVVAAGLALTKSHRTPVGTGVVVIETNLAYQGAQAAGTGMVLTSSGEVLTNNHVIRGATDDQDRLPGTGRSYTAQRHRLRRRGRRRRPPGERRLGPEDRLAGRLGPASATAQSVTAIGNAGGTGRLTPATGTVTDVDRSITVSDDQGGSESLSGLIETNAPSGPAIPAGRC